MNSRIVKILTSFNLLNSISRPDPILSCTWYELRGELTHNRSGVRSSGKDVVRGAWGRLKITTEAGSRRARSFFFALSAKFSVEGTGITGEEREKN